MALSVTDLRGADVAMVTVFVRRPCPICCFPTLYSPSWSIKALVRMASKNALSRPTSVVAGAFCHAAPQKIVQTSTAVRSGPCRYVSCAAAAAGSTSAALTYNGTIRIASGGGLRVTVLRADVRVGMADSFEDWPQGRICV